MDATNTTKEVMDRYPAYRESGVDWLGEVPAHWEVKRIKYLFTEKNDRSEDGQGNLLSVSQYTGVSIRTSEDDKELVTRAATLEGYKKVSANDLVSNIMLAWNGSLGFSSFDGVTSPAYGVYELKEGNDVRYFHYLLRSELYKSEYKRNSTGVIESRLRLYTDDFYGIWSILPPLEEQTAIARYLDERTAQIDRAVAQKERLIELLRERQQILVQRAVTKGLDPNAPMRDSGVEWLGEVPVGWEVKRLKYLFVEFNERSETGQEELLSLRMNAGLVPHNQVSDIYIGPNQLIGYKRVRKGTLVMNRMRAATGLFAVADGTGLVSPDYATFEILPNVNEHFYLLLFKTELLRTIFRLNSKGMGTGASGFMRLYTDKFNDIRVGVPPLEEQKRIVEHIRNIATKTTQAITLQQTQIERLREYKATLVDVVVTGRVKVV